MDGGNDGQVATEARFDIPIEVITAPLARLVCESERGKVPMVMGEKNEVDSRQFTQVDGRIGSTRARDARAEMDVISGVEEIGLP